MPHANMPKFHHPVTRYTTDPLNESMRFIGLHTSIEHTCHVTRETQFCVSPVWILLHVTLLALKIWMWLTDFWNIFAQLRTARSYADGLRAVSRCHTQTEQLCHGATHKPNRCVTVPHTNRTACHGAQTNRTAVSRWHTQTYNRVTVPHTNRTAVSRCRTQTVQRCHTQTVQPCHGATHKPYSSVTQCHTQIVQPCHGAIHKSYSSVTVPHTNRIAPSAGEAQGLHASNNCFIRMKLSIIQYFNRTSRLKGSCSQYHVQISTQRLPNLIKAFHA